ncbi:MAG: hypothetical protein ABIO40_05335 [Devosia sp.]
MTDSSVKDLLDGVPPINRGDAIEVIDVVRMEAKLAGTSTAELNLVTQYVLAKWIQSEKKRDSLAAPETLLELALQVADRSITALRELAAEHKAKRVIARLELVGMLDDDRPKRSD